jgi:endonuclease/exonuclease/phosphatase family metal-dependent hydrolase
MKIITWNCNTHPSVNSSEKAVKSFAEKIKIINHLDFDILILQEIARPEFEKLPQQVWYAEDGVFSRGIGILTKSNYHVELDPDFSPTCSSLPLKVNGEKSFNLLALWSHPPIKRPSLKQYVEEIELQIETLKPFLESAPSVIVGDFNSNSRWDKSAGKQHNHTKLVTILENEFGLKSCYHSYSQEQQGNEAKFTLFQNYKIEKSFHIDYCFVPNNWQIIDVQIGNYDFWVKSRLSDHCPLTVEID